MTRVALVAIIILFSVSSVNFVDSLQDNFGRFLGTFTTVKQYILILPIVLSLREKEKEKYFCCASNKVCALCNDVTSFPE